MSAVIKAGKPDQSVRSISAGTQRSGLAAITAVASADALALARAEDKIAQLESALVDAREATVRTERAALERGKKEGVEEARHDADERVSLLRDALVAARRDWNGRLANIEALAAMLARSALEKIFVSTADLSERTSRAIARQLQMLRADSVLTIRVSELDFPSAEALEEICLDAGKRHIAVKTCPALNSGEAWFDLHLGHLAVGPSAQWRELADLLDTLADEGATA